MAGPGEYIPDVPEGITCVENLPKKDFKNKLEELLRKRVEEAKAAKQRKFDEAKKALESVLKRIFKEN